MKFGPAATNKAARFRLAMRSIGLCAGALGALITTAAPSNAQTAQMNVRGSKQYIVGANTAWFSYAEGFCFGHMPTNYSWGVNYNSNDVETAFADANAMHVNVVRVWMFDKLQGCTLDSSGNVNGVESNFYTNIDDMMTRANNHGLAVYLTLCANMQSVVGQSSYYGGTVANPITANSAAQSAFINNAIIPLLQHFHNAAYHNAIFGYEAYNEGEISINAGTFSMTDLRNFTSNVATAVHTYDSGEPVSCDSTNPADFTSANFNNTFGGLGLDFYDLHSYTDEADIPLVSATAVDKPIILGEYGNSGGNNIANQLTADDAFVRQMASRGYAGGFVWSMNCDTAYNIVDSNNNPTSVGDYIGWYGQQLGISGTGSYGNPVEYANGYDFENGDTEGWAGGSSTSTTSSTAYTGSNSLQVNVNQSGSGTITAYCINPWANAGTTVTAHVYIPAGAPVSSAQFYTQEGTSTGYNWTSYSFTPSLGSWQTVQFTIPSTAESPVFSMGLQIFTSGSWNGSFYLDGITFSGGGSGSGGGGGTGGGGTGGGGGSSSITPHSGSYMAEVNPGGNWNNLCQNVNVNQNTNYTVTFYSVGTGQIYLRVLTTDWSTTLGANGFTPASSSSWGQQSLTFNSGSNSQVVIDFTDAYSGGTTYLDDVVCAASDNVNVLTDGDFEQGAGQTAWLVQSPFQIVDPAVAGPPAAPTGLKATAGTKRVALSWQSSTHATSYKIFRGTKSGGESGRAIASISGTSYTNTGLITGVTYYYTITAVDSAGASSPSNEASARAK